LAEDVVETILLVDDNPTNLEVLFQTLDQRGYRLLAARSGEDALNIARAAHPSLVLLDVMMPGMDGFEVCAAIKHDPELADIPVIFLSALGDTESKVRGLELGGVDYVSKPFQADEIVARVGTHIKLRRLERELALRNRELESDIRHILVSMNEGIYGLSPDGVVDYANPAAARMTGWAEADLLDRNALTLHFDARASWIRRLRGANAFPDGRAIEVDRERMRCKDGSTLDVTLVVNPQYRDGLLSGLVMVFRDIGDALRRERELQEARSEVQAHRERISHLDRLSTMGEMTAGFAHEVNQPLTAIANYASVSRRMLRKDPLDRDKLAETLEKLQAQAVRASEVVQRLRNFVQKPKSGKVISDPNELVREVMELAEVDSKHNKVPVKFDPVPGLPRILVDDIQIQQVALNLIRNGMEAMAGARNRSRGVTIVLSLTADHMVRFAVVDHGVGLEPDAEEKLFLPFYSTKPQGMGIGLSVCASIIQDHRGRISFTRNADGGTTFYFDLPAEAPAVDG